MSADDDGVPTPCSAPPAFPTEGEADYVVVGAGVAGLTAALCLSRHGTVRLLVKSRLGDGCSPLAQGGIAAAVADDDCVGDHLADTLTAGCGLVHEAAARLTTSAGPAVLRWLTRTGVQFDRRDDGALCLGREGGHHRHRIAHAGGDATGAAVCAALTAAARIRPSVTVTEDAFAQDLLLDARGRVAGVVYEYGGIPVRLAARAVVLATGGYASLFPATTNPGHLTADGIACALRAGAEVCDMEFVQFHPTVLWTGASDGQLPLVSEAVRGEGGRLLDQRGRAVMDGVHPLGDLAPRDVVSRTIALRMAETGDDHVLLDARHLGSAGWAARFPTIRAHCVARGIDPAFTPIPVAPAAHYSCGGIRTDLAGRTSLPGLYAGGETACTGLHGANRLASNSLLEAVVFGHRIADDAHARTPLRTPVTGPPAPSPPFAASERPALRAALARGAGILRSHDQLTYALAQLEAMTPLPPGRANRAERETGNLHLAARALVLAALDRTESRGSHYRTDHPDTDPVPARSLIRLTPDGLAVHRDGAQLSRR